MFVWTYSWSGVTAQQQAGTCTLNIETLQRSNLFYPNINLVGHTGDYLHRATVILYCRRGYDGIMEITCENGTWKTVYLRDVPCKPMRCGHPGEVDNGYAVLDKDHTEYELGATVSYNCSRGYMVVGTNRLMCTANMWEGRLPVCQAVDCGVIETAPNVQVQVGSTTYNHIASFSCKDQTQAVYGDQQVSCEANGRWSNGPPTCGDVKCTAPDIDNGEAVQKDYSNGDQLSFRCNAGFGQNPTRPVCILQNRKAMWSFQPFCGIAKCTLPSVPGTAYERTMNGDIFPEESVTVKCSGSYWIAQTKDISKQITCQKDGNWDSDPTCEEIMCEAKEIPNSLPDRLERTKLHTTKEFHCLPGFKQDTKKTVCQRDGWTPSPVCQSVCPYPSRVMNAVIKEPNQPYYKVGSTVTYMCRHGYLSRGVTSMSTTCQSNHKWFPAPPNCEKQCRQ